MNENLQNDDRLFEIVAQEPEDVAPIRAPARLKSRIYSAMVREQEKSGPLRGLAETHGLCVFEELWERATSTDAAQSFNCCSLCHARVLAERLERAPIYWANCPYVAFGKK
jgi:hypothetical protein